MLTELKNNPEKCIALGWEDKVSQEFSAALRLELMNKKGVLATLATHLSEMGSNIESINMAEKDASLTVINVIVSVRDRVHLARILRKLRKLPSVVRLQRL
jgi:guanosine-3',5'-bis(diphosphate) 3'-pyrophosphohydrolase